MQAPQGRSDQLYGGTSAPGARATGATDGWWWQHLRAPLGVARLHVLPCLHSREYGSALHRSPQAHPRGPVCEGAPPPRRAPPPRSFGRPEPFVCRSPGQRPTHSLKGVVVLVLKKVVCPRPPRTSRCCSTVPVAVEAQPCASTAGKSSSLERRGRSNVQVRAAELLAFLLTEQHSPWCNCMC